MILGLTVPWWEIVLRTAAIYFVVLALLRVAGKRELGQFSAVDLVVILVISNAVQNAMTGGDNSLFGGILAAATLVGINLLVARVADRVPAVAHLFRSDPTLLLDDGKLIDDHLEREHVTREEVEMAAREHGIDDLGAVQAAILERDGSISIIPRDSAMNPRARRRLRQLRRSP